VADTQLVVDVDVGVGGGEVRDGVLAQDEPLVHRLVDDAADLLFVGPDGLQLGRCAGGPNDLLIDVIEVDRDAAAV